jgi:hypothetical protein
LTRHKSSAEESVWWLYLLLSVYIAVVYPPFIWMMQPLLSIPPLVRKRSLQLLFLVVARNALRMIPRVYIYYYGADDPRNTRKGLRMMTRRNSDKHGEC